MSSCGCAALGADAGAGVSEPGQAGPAPRSEAGGHLALAPIFGVRETQCAESSWWLSLCMQLEAAHKELARERAEKEVLQAKYADLAAENAALRQQLEELKLKPHGVVTEGVVSGICKMASGMTDQYLPFSPPLLSTI